MDIFSNRRGRAQKYWFFPSLSNSQRYDVLSTYANLFAMMSGKENVLVVMFRNSAMPDIIPQIFGLNMLSHVADGNAEPERTFLKGSFGVLMR